VITADVDARPEKDLTADADDDRVLTALSLTDCDERVVIDSRIDIVGVKDAVPLSEETADAEDEDEAGRENFELSDCRADSVGIAEIVGKAEDDLDRADDDDGAFVTVTFDEDDASGVEDALREGIDDLVKEAVAIAEFENCDVIEAPEDGEVEMSADADIVVETVELLELALVRDSTPLDVELKVAPEETEAAADTDAAADSVPENEAIEDEESDTVSEAFADAVGEAAAEDVPEETRVAADVPVSYWVDRLLLLA
jgi:hypothetical protein